MFEVISFQQAREMMNKNRALYLLEGQSGRLQDDILYQVGDTHYLCQHDELGRLEDEYNDRLMGIY